jgi:hypothetical protein
MEVIVTLGFYLEPRPTTSAFSFYASDPKAGQIRIKKRAHPVFLKAALP